MVSLLSQERRHWLVPTVSLQPLWKGRLVVSLEMLHRIILLESCSCFPSGAMGEAESLVWMHTHGSWAAFVAMHRMGDFNPAAPREFKPLEKRIKPRQYLCFKNQNNNNKKTSQVNYTRAGWNLWDVNTFPRTLKANPFLKCFSFTSKQENALDKTNFAYFSFDSITC